MYELKQVGRNTYYIDCPTKVGIYVYENNNICLIDSGNDKDVAKKIYRIIEEHKWNLKYIVNTHSHADHIGGNKYLQEKTNCMILSTEIEMFNIKYPHFEPSLLYGAFPFKELNNKFLVAAASNSVASLTNLPMGLKYFPLDGHSFGMVGIKTKDDVYFIADSVSSINTLNKYGLVYIYDIEKYLETLTMLKSLDGKLCIPAHSEETFCVSEIAQVNTDKVFEIISNIKSICFDSKSFEDILQELFSMYDLKMDFNQYVLVGSTLRSYLSYMHNLDMLTCEFVENVLLYSTKK